MAHYPNSQQFTEVLCLNRFEADITDLEIEGEVPLDINGYFFRVHPDQQFPPKFDNDQFFNGDGMISRFNFRSGHVDFRQRWARTDKWKLEHSAGKALFGAYRNPLTDDASVKGAIRGTANTTPIVHGGKLLSLKEDSPPLLMDPETMETLGYSDLNGKLKSETFSAHPKVCPDSGNLCNFSYAAKGLLTEDCSYMEVSPDGELLFETFFKVPYYCMMHDFAITENYALFHIVPIVSDWARLEENKPHFCFDPTLPVFLGVLPRHQSGTNVRWYKAPKTVFASHVMNAYEDDRLIHFLIPEAEGNCFPFFPDISGKAFEPRKALPRLCDWVIDINGNSEAFKSVERLSDLIGEFPRIDDRYCGKRNRHGWMLTNDPTREYAGQGGRISGFKMNVLAHFDFDQKTEDLWWCGPECLIQEPCFIPRDQNSIEGDGYIVAIVDNMITNYSYLAILEATNLGKGPLAKVKLPFRLRSGLHGSWSPRG